MQYNLTLTPEEAQRVVECAKWCAERGLKPNEGDPLGPSITNDCMATEWIRFYSERFRTLVAREKAKLDQSIDRESG